MTGRSLSVALLVALATLLVALSTAPHRRPLALFAWLLLLASGALAVLVRRLASTSPEPSEVLVGEPERQPRMRQLEEIEESVAEALRSRSVTPVAPLVRRIAAARLARDHGIDLELQPERAHALLGDGLLWEAVRPRGAGERAPAPRLRSADLLQAIDELERL